MVCLAESKQVDAGPPAQNVNVGFGMFSILDGEPVALQTCWTVASTIPDALGHAGQQD